MEEGVKRFQCLTLKGGNLQQPCLGEKGSEYPAKHPAQQESAVSQPRGTARLLPGDPAL